MLTTGVWSAIAVPVTVPRQAEGQSVLMCEPLKGPKLRAIGPLPCRTLRQDVYTAYETRASSGSTNNSPVVEQIMSLRQEQARLAGYSNAAEYLMSNKVSIHIMRRVASQVLAQ